MFDFSIRYAFIRGRQLEGTYPGDPKVGVWGITSNRVNFGWGLISAHEWPYFNRDVGDFLDPEPPGLDHLAKRHRIHHYERIRSSSDARVILERNKKFCSSNDKQRGETRPGQFFLVRLAFEVPREFVDAPGGLIALPSADAPVLGTHGVVLSSYSHSQGWFEFNNTWGTGWGNNGQGYMPTEFVDGWMTESWATDFSRAELPERRGIQELSWDSTDPLGDRIYGFEIYDGDADERIGWSFIVNRGDYLDVEELYVRPFFRGQGFGSRLARMILDFARTYKGTLRAWVPFIDSHEVNRPPLARVMIKLGLNIRRSGVPWAAYLALPSKNTRITFDTVRVPAAPAYSRSESRQPISRDPPSESHDDDHIYEGPLTEDDLSEVADSLFCALDAEEAGHAER